MGNLEVLCTTMNQTDFSLFKKMNLNSNVIFANQTDKTGFEERVISGCKVRLISTTTRGVGKNRNISLLYAEGDILLFADDDIEYYDSYKEKIMSEFAKYPKADIIIFNIQSNSGKRKQYQNKTSHRLGCFSRLPYGAPRVAIRRSSWEKSNVWFTTLFGGGCKYTSGEDSIFLFDLKKAGLNIYVSNICIGTIDMEVSSWFRGRNEEYFFNKGAYCAAKHTRFIILWCLYYCIRIRAKLSIRTKILSFNKGVIAYKESKEFKDYKDNK